jgi:hypothetical protein
MCYLLREQKKWGSLLREQKNGFSPKGTEKMGSLLKEHTKLVLFYGNKKWVLFYGNKKWLSSLGT